MSQPCPLCHTPAAHHLHRDEHRAYLRCPECALIFVSRKDLLTPDEEKARYDLHNNRPDDPNYRRFLRQLTDPLIQRMGPPPLKGLDFGSGPGPTLSVMLQESGYDMHLYDPYYARQAEVLMHSYDFITCTEAIEHFYNPSKEWELLVGLVRPGGWLGFMTKLIDNPQDFPEWYYINDRTHVSFFSRQTFNFLAKRDGLGVEFIGDNVVLLQKYLDSAQTQPLNNHNE